MSNANFSYITVPTEFITAENGIRFAYRRMGEKAEVPIILFNHLTSNLDNADPRIMDALAAKHEIISFDYRGVGATSGEDAKSIQDMAKDGLAFIKALGYEKVDIFSFSMGGFIIQELMEMEPNLVRKLILAGTGPRGGQGVSAVVGLTYWDIVKGFFNIVDPKYFLFFTSTENGKKAAKLFLSRLKERTVDRDIAVGIHSLRTQLSAIEKWGHEAPADLSKFTLPVLVINGDNDRMVPTPNSYNLAQRFPNAELHIYPDAGHGGIFQEYEDFSKRALAFFAD
ncbi:alpha/beta hydrolase [Chryseobacterium sp. Ch-15]|uniref:Alpha/beta hydrolase n=1 Tax=Chryseobacterium muglaense TaxID=2893752 RepID=A0A9Q3UZG8_9FLAO|nr:alpha/beta hydrolase [Chryseobacterium muglaense]MBD3903289.1 alpha/beta hydrolase [Chryseobacterium muglaense]MCC9036119.1 alpha/beta hydrolase [Chryseobacterium muglaense]MCM2553305.1 alpha/beta hydrolase [Chryseobacterium muglaense]